MQSVHGIPSDCFRPGVNFTWELCCLGWHGVGDASCWDSNGYNYERPLSDVVKDKQHLHWMVRNSCCELLAGDSSGELPQPILLCKKLEQCENPI